MVYLEKGSGSSIIIYQAWLIVLLLKMRKYRSYRNWTIFLHSHTHFTCDMYVCKPLVNILIPVYLENGNGRYSIQIHVHVFLKHIIILCSVLSLVHINPVVHLRNTPLFILFCGGGGGGGVQTLHVIKQCVPLSTHSVYQHDVGRVQNRIILVRF